MKPLRRMGLVVWAASASFPAAAQERDVRTHHTSADFFERVRERDLQQSAIVLAAFAYHAAMRAGPLPRGPALPATPEGGAR